MLKSNEKTYKIKMHARMILAKNMDKLWNSKQVTLHN
jgi:hypothetical protein